MKKFSLLLIIIALVSCKENKGEETQKINSEGMNGTFSALVIFSNPNTGISGKYKFNVEVVNNSVTRIDWPDNFWLDFTDFRPAPLDTHDSCSFLSNNDSSYKVKILGPKISNYEVIEHYDPSKE